VALAAGENVWCMLHNSSARAARPPRPPPPLRLQWVSASSTSQRFWKVYLREREGG
jgi:hypothetical protein